MFCFPHVSVICSFNVQPKIAHTVLGIYFICNTFLICHHSFNIISCTVYVTYQLLVLLDSVVSHDEGSSQNPEPLNKCLDGLVKSQV